MLRVVFTWLTFDKNKDGRMNFKEVRKLLKMMSMDINEQHAMLLFKVRIKKKNNIVMVIFLECFDRLK